MSSAAQEMEKPRGGFAVLWRFLPMLWPKDDAELRLRVVAAVLLVFADKAITLAMPFAYKAVVDAMSAAGGLDRGADAGRRPMPRRGSAGCWPTTSATLLFEKVGQNAARRLRRGNSGMSTPKACASTWSGGPEA